MLTLCRWIATRKRLIYIRKQVNRVSYGAIHLWRPHEGEGGQAQVDTCERGEGVQPHVDVHTEN